MIEEKEDPILAAPTLVKEESTLMDPHDGDTTSNNVDSTSNEKEKNRLKYDQRRISLLNNPNYGVILSFLDKFHSHVDLQDYPLHLLEENLLSDEENISPRLIDFHITLLKRITLGKGAQRDKFVPVITKFAYRFDYDDGEYLKANGYSQAEIDIKLRILKNLLETQFDYNQGFKTALIEKQAFEVRSQPFGRDRSGASYWLFLDNECFIRLFRETVDDERNWTNVAKDNDELESIIRLLVTDYVVRKKFPDWKFTHEPLNSLEQSHEFEQLYAVKLVNVKKESELEIKPSSPSLLSPAEPINNKCNSIIKSTKSLSKGLIKNEVQSHGESLNSVDKNGERSRVVSSEDANPMELAREINNNQEDKELKSPTKKSRGRRKSSNWNKKKRRTMSNTSKKDEPEPEIQTPKTPMKGRKRKQLVVDANEIEDTKRKEETSQDKDTTQILLDDELNINEDLPIALRRSRRARKAPINELSSTTSSPTKSVSHTPTKKKLTNGKLKSASQTTMKASSKSNRHRKRGRRRGNGKSSVNGCSSSDEDNQPSEEEEDEYDTDDYLPDKTQIDELNDDDLLEQEEDDDEFVPRRSAKTVAKRHVQMNENNIEASSSSCCVCSKTDRPESLLLCDDCDDPYHLECLKPILLAVPDGDWYCPLCEHKRLCDNLVEKLIQLIKEHEELEIKRTQCMSKRSNRLANVMLNLDRMVKRSSKKRRPNGIVYSDEEKEDEDNKSENEEDENNDDDGDDDDDDSVYGFKDDASIDDTETQKSRRDAEEMESSDRLGVRSCRRKPQNYRFDDYDKKMKEAMIEAGVNGDEIDKDSDESDKEDKTTATKKRGAYNKDDDFDISDTKKDDDEFAPDPNRSDDSATEEEEDYDEDDTSDDDDDGWKSKRRSSPKKKSKSKSNRNSRKSKTNSDDDESLSETELNHFQTVDTTKSDTMNDDDLNETNDDRRRSTRTAAQKSYSKQQDDDNSEEDDDEDLFENGRPPPRRMRYKKRRGSDDSFVDDDDDYEKLARKRKIVKYGKSISRSSITDHIKKLVDEESQPSEGKVSASASQDETKEEINDTPKQQNKVPSTDYEEPPQSDDDDFPDEQEIFKANGLLKLQNNLSGPKPAAFRPPFMAPTHSYQHAIVDPTARFAMIRPSVRPATNIVYSSNGLANNLVESQQPSDSNQVNGYISPSW
ncbi:unnamed protein product [Rotaria magnacalcarata]|uniref:Remodeling and spacing factor 1 n=1 Tax=Rotaria magnacalcarata TaxID=392030 RepID=A0A819H506_9BILA|nr:unnamed protein product [Rotaria magnacalcarata]